MAKKLRSFGGKSLRSPSSGKPSMNELLKKVNQASDSMQEIEDEFAQKDFQISAGGGVIRLTMKGDFHVKEIAFDDDLLKDKEDLIDLLSAAFNEAIETVTKEKDTQMEQIKEELGINQLGF
jgi:DNA-binding YbaB/EbfC family protein